MRRWTVGASGSSRTPAGLLVLSFVVTLCGCAPTVLDIANHNRENLSGLRVGMAREEALGVMGSSTTYARVGGPVDTLLIALHINRFPVSNPYRSAAAVAKDGETAEVLYYYTDEKRAELNIMDDELTPIVLKGGRVVGWGQAFFDDAVQRYEIRLR